MTRRCLFPEIVLVSSLLLFCAMAYSQNAPSVRVLRLTNDGGKIKVGGLPLMLAAYDDAGHQGSGSSGISMSGNYSNTIIDLEEIPRSLDPFWPTIGAQVSGGKTAATVSVRKRKVERLFLDADGLAFREERRSVAEGGPYISMTFIDPATKIIALSSIDVTVSNAAGKKLETTPQDFEIVLVKSVQREPLLVEVSDKQTGVKWSTKLFPMFRSSEPDLVFYTVTKVPIGKSLATDPSYEEKTTVQMSSRATTDQEKCDAGDFQACNDLAVLFQKGDGVTQNSAEALRLYDKACVGGFAMACSNLGTLYGVGEGVKQDYAKAGDFFKKGCDLNDGASCYNLAATLQRNPAVKSDPEERRRLMTKACELGLKQACAYR